MTTSGLVFLVLVISALSLFAGTLAWACWMEGREKKRAAAVTNEPTHRAF